jgi:hypothetical protein
VSAIRISLAAALLISGARTLAAQTVTDNPSPTLPSDTLQANYAPRSRAAPMPDLAPTLPSDTLQATQPVDSFPSAPRRPDADSASSTGGPGAAYHAVPETPGDSAELRELRSWMQRHPGLMAPPPSRAVLTRV